MSLGQALNWGQVWNSGSCDSSPGFGKKRYMHVSMHACAHTCVSCMYTHAYVYRVCIHCMHVCVLGVGDQGGAPILMVPKDASQEPVSCPSPAHLGEQSSFQLTAACVC